MTPLAHTIGPVLVLDDIDAAGLQLAALFLAPPGITPAAPETTLGPAVPEPIFAAAPGTLWRARFRLPADRPGSYAWQGTTFPVAADMGGDLRLGYVSCNGEEIGDLDRDDGERNAMWARLCRQHRDAPLSLLLHGGDQIYADQATEGHPLSEGWPGSVPPDPTPAALADLERHLSARFFERYAAVYGAPDFAWLAARVPSLGQWDDHDICDGWGSLDPAVLNSAVGRTLFDVARRAFLAFQQACCDGGLPTRFGDPAGAHLGWGVSAPGLRILAPDLRSERQPTRVMGPGGWAFMEQAAEASAPARTLLLSSVPLLGPRLSLLERTLLLAPGAQKYEDDLRDQWQSHAHRAEWIRMLRLIDRIASRERVEVTALSGEIHLATRATMSLNGAKTLHQLVASGVAHRPPPAAFATALGLLARLGEDPLPDRPIAIRPLPGRRQRYTAERNVLLLDRHDGAWSARWDLETSGLTPPLPL